MEDENFEIYEKKPDHSYRTEMPNIVYELGFDPYVLAIYALIKRSAGDSGSFWRSYANMAKMGGMSSTTAKACIKKLEQTHPILGMPLIEVQKRFKADGSQTTNLITIVDIWRQNGDYFRAKAAQKKSLENSNFNPRDVYPGSGRIEKTTETPLPSVKPQEESSVMGYDEKPRQGVNSKPCEDIYANQEKRVKSFPKNVVDLASEIDAVLKADNEGYTEKVHSKPFLDSVRLMLEVDKHKPELVVKVLKWALSDKITRGDWKGWSSVMYKKNPAEKLREHFAKLCDQMKSKKERTFAPNSNLEEDAEKMKNAFRKHRSSDE
jgi:hypothetical protein